MPDLVEHMYCSQQIFIPPNLPTILKKYSKAAIRTQPRDLLTWSSAYFKALANGVLPPTKDRIEYPPVKSSCGMSPGFLKVLINQIGKRETVSKEILTDRWTGVCLNLKDLQDLMDVGMFDSEVNWFEFLGICTGTLESSLTRTMIQLCELLTDEPEGGRAAIPVTVFLNLYKYLAKLECGPVNIMEQYERALEEDSETQCLAGQLTPTEAKVSTEVPIIEWDQAIESLRERDSDNSVDTKASADGMMIWPDIKLLQKEGFETVALLEKEVTSDDGIEVFTEVQLEPHQNDMKLLPEQQDELQIEKFDQEENIFAPPIDSFADFMDAESPPIEETTLEELTTASKLNEPQTLAGSQSVLSNKKKVESTEKVAELEGVLGQNDPQSLKEEQPDQRQKQDQEHKARKDCEVESLVKKDSDMMLLPTPITSDIMLYMDNAGEKSAFEVSPTQQLSNKLSMIDIEVSVPVDETIVEVVERHRYPKWMHIPGIGPMVPDHIVEAVEKYFLSVSELQEGMVMPRNIKHFNCPQLELLPGCTEEIS